ncbi:MAG: glycosyltransferase family 2 protein [Alphaproteobacteria bacterium]|nr:glycosyltransferase family 2 protein [Alphaproteobacteria bacterium]
MDALADGPSPTPASEPELTVVCPMFNEADGIVAALDRLVPALQALSLDRELVLVDDGSTDGSGDLARARLASVPWARVVGHTPNRGRGFALRQGLAAARGRFVVTTEADLTWGADVPARLHAALVRSGADVVVASPYRAGGGLFNVPLHRRLGSQGMNLLLGTVLPVTMSTGMTRGYRREAVRSLTLTADGKDLHVEILARAVDAGLRIEEIPCRLTWPPGRRGRMPDARMVARHLLAFSRLAWDRP